MAKPQKGRRSDANRRAKKRSRPSLLSGLPDWVQDHARKARAGAKTPSEVVQRWGGMLDGVLGRYMQSFQADLALTDAGDDLGTEPNWEGLVRVVTPLAEARRKMAATEAELSPRTVDRAEITHDLTTREDGKPDGGPAMWRGPDAAGVVEVRGDEPEDD